MTNGQWPKRASDGPKIYGAPYVSKLKNKRVFIYPAWNIQIQCRIYKSSLVHNISSTGFIYPARNLYIHHRIYISTTGFIYPVRDIYIQPGIYISSTGFIYPAWDLYIQPGIYISSQGFIYQRVGRLSM